MEIKTVGVDKLFSLGNYNNERISMTATVSEGENADSVVAKLFLKVTSIEDMFSTYRKIVDQTDDSERRIAMQNERVENLKREITDMKIKIDELNDIVNKGGDVSEERLNHACRSKSYKDLKEKLQSEQDQLSYYQTAFAKYKEIRDTIKQRITEGVFNTDGLDIPVLPTESRYY